MDINNEEFWDGIFSKSEEEETEDFINYLRKTAPAKRTGIVELDRLLYGGFHNQTYSLCAGTSLGKSSLSQFLLENIIFTEEKNNASKRTYILYLCLEMPDTEMKARGTSAFSFKKHKENKNLKAYTFSEILPDGEIYSDTIEDFVHINPESYIPYAREYRALTGKYIKYFAPVDGEITFKGIKAAVKSFKKKHPNSNIIIAVDYLQIITPDREDPLEKDEIGFLKAICRKLQALAIQEKVTVLYPTATTKTGSKEPTDSMSGNGSAYIGYSASCSFGLERVGINYPKATTQEMKEYIYNREKQDGYRIMHLNFGKGRNNDLTNGLFFRYYSAYNYWEIASESEVNELLKRIDDNNTSDNSDFLYVEANSVTRNPEYKQEEFDGFEPANEQEVPFDVEKEQQKPRFSAIRKV